MMGFEPLTVGYVTLYSGQISATKGKIEFNELVDLIDCFSKFLSFINGRRCAPLFFTGTHNDQIIWTDFSGYSTDQFKYVFTWPSKTSAEGLDQLWQTFSHLWNDPNERDFINSAIHWYVESNAHSGYLEGSIILSQVALELIYNWVVVEKRKLLLRKHHCRQQDSAPAFTGKSSKFDPQCLY